MTKPSVRQTILVRSVDRLLPPGEKATTVIMMFSRHRWFMPYAIASGIVLVIVSAFAGVAGTANLLVLGLCGTAVAAMATTDYHVLAETNEGLVLLRSSRVRQYAKEIRHRVEPGPITMVGSNLITSDWKIGSAIYTLTKRWEADMRQLTMGEDE